MFDKLQDVLIINETYKNYLDYWCVYKIESNLIDTVGITTVLSSCLFDCASVCNYQKVRDTIAMTISPPEEFGQNTIFLVSGGRVAKDAADPYSSVPCMANISLYQYDIVESRWPAGSSEEVKALIGSDVTNVKGATMKAFAPNGGGIHE